MDVKLYWARARFPGGSGGFYVHFNGSVPSWLIWPDWVRSTSHADKLPRAELERELARTAMLRRLSGEGWPDGKIIIEEVT